MSDYARTLNGLRKVDLVALVIEEKRKKPASQARGALPANELRRQRGRVRRMAGVTQAQISYPSYVGQRARLGGFRPEELARPTEDRCCAHGADARHRGPGQRPRLPDPNGGVDRSIMGPWWLQVVRPWRTAFGRGRPPEPKGNGPPPDRTALASIDCLLAGDLA